MKVRPSGDGLGVKRPKTTEGEAGPATLFQIGGAVLGHRTLLPTQDGAQATTNAQVATRIVLADSATTEDVSVNGPGIWVDRA